MEQLDPLWQTQSGLINESQAVAGPGYLLLCKNPPDWSQHWLERQLSTAFQVRHTGFLHANPSDIQSLGYLPVGLSQRIGGAKVAEPTENDLPLLAPGQHVPLATAPFLQLKG